MAASSSASAWAFTVSSMPFVCVSKRVEAAAVPNEELVEDRADTPLFMFFWLLFVCMFVGGQLALGVSCVGGVLWWRVYV